MSVERGAPADAEAALARVERDFPKSGWRPKARLERAGLLHQLRRDAEAEAIVSADAAALLADGRRTELVRLVVDLGDARTLPPAEIPGVKSDLARAVALYQSALDLDPPKALGNEVRLKLGLTAQKAGNAALAIESLTRFLQESGAAATTPDGANARLALGRARLFATDLAGARRTLEDLADELAKAPDLSAELTKAKAGALLAIADTWNLQVKENVPLRTAALRRSSTSTRATPRRGTPPSPSPTAGSSSSAPTTRSPRSTGSSRGPTASSAPGRPTRRAGRRRSRRSDAATSCSSRRRRSSPPPRSPTVSRAIRRVRSGPRRRRA